MAKMNSKYFRFVQGAEDQIKMVVIIAVPIAANLDILWAIAPLFNKNEINNFKITVLSRAKVIWKDLYS